MVEGEPRFEEPVDLDGFSVPPDALTKETVADSAALPDLEAAATSYRHWWHELYSAERDMTGLRAESNVLRYRPLTKVIVRVASRGGEAEIGLLRRATSVVGVTLEVSAPRGPRCLERSSRRRKVLLGGSPPVEQIGSALSVQLEMTWHGGVTSTMSRSTIRPSRATAGSSCRVGCASRRFRGPSIDMAASRLKPGGETRLSRALSIRAMASGEPRSGLTDKSGEHRKGHLGE